MKLKEILFGIGIIGSLAGIVVGCILHNKRISDELFVDVPEKNDDDLETLMDAKALHREETMLITSDSIDIPDSAIDAVRQMQEGMKSTFKEDGEDD